MLIELFMTEFIRSPSTRGCGLKSHGTNLSKGDKVVTLYTRVWIEIFNEILDDDYHQVTLYTRVWIEIKL